jgi:RHS repeat-associated protein
MYHPRRARSIPQNRISFQIARPFLYGNRATDPTIPLETESHTTLAYNRARYYDPKIGRWIEQDPLGFEAGDDNLYRYVANQPTLATDPSGQFTIVGVSYLEPNARENSFAAADLPYGNQAPFKRAGYAIAKGMKQNLDKLGYQFVDITGAKDQPFPPFGGFTEFRLFEAVDRVKKVGLQGAIFAVKVDIRLAAQDGAITATLEERAIHEELAHGIFGPYWKQVAKRSYEKPLVKLENVKPLDLARDPAAADTLCIADPTGKDYRTLILVDAPYFTFESPEKSIQRRTVRAKLLIRNETGQSYPIEYSFRYGLTAERRFFFEFLTRKRVAR